MSEGDALAAVEASREASAARATAEVVRIADAYRRLFNTEDGKIVYDDLRRRFVDIPIARPGHGPDHAFFREGRRSTVAFIYQMKESQEVISNVSGYFPD